MQTIAFYSYKGGVGRSLVLANVAHYLARLGQKVVALDLDLEAPGLHYKLLPQPKEGDLGPQGVVDFLDVFVTQGQVPEHIQDYLVPVPLPERVKGEIHLMPAGRAPSSDYWRKLSRLSLHDLFYRDGAPGIPLFLELKERIRDAYQPDLLLVDARTGITEIGGVATTVLPDQVVCLLLNNRENLEGARAVLRGLRHAPRPPGASAAVEIVPVLSRLPRAEGDDQDRAIVAAVRDYLNAPADRLEDTLDLDEPLVLHVERQLEQRERVLIASPDDHRGSPLLKDYLRLFARLIPASVLHPQVGAIIERAKEALFTDPDGAQGELENLAEVSGRPEAYRALLQLYQVRNVADASVVFPVAERLWELTGDGQEPLVFDAVRKYFKAFSRKDLAGSPALGFVEGVWRANGASDIELGLQLAESYSDLDQPDRLEGVVMDLAGQPELDHKFGEQLVILLTKTGRLEAAEALVERFPPKQRGSVEFLTAWGRSVLKQKGQAVPSRLLEALDAIANEDPEVALRLATRAERTDLAERLADGLLDIAVHRGPSAELEEIALWFFEQGRGEELQARTIKGLGPRGMDFLADIERRRRDRERSGDVTSRIRSALREAESALKLRRPGA